MNPIQIPNGGGKRVNILGIPMLIRIQGHDTGGVLSVVESHDVRGGGPPPNIHHREDETFQILEGEYEWMVGDKKFMAQKGHDDFRATRRAAHLSLPRPNAGPAYVHHHAVGLRGILRGNWRAESAATAGHPARNGDWKEILSGKSLGLDRLARIDLMQPDDPAFHPPPDSEFCQLPDTDLTILKKPADSLGAAQVM